MAIKPKEKLDPGIRLSVIIQQEFKDDLAFIQHEMRAETMAEALRRSIKIVRKIIEWENDGTKIIGRKKNGTEVEISFF